jgi:MFS superfamily sulfate permease-like transporter
VAAAALAAVLVAGTGLLHGIPLAALAAVVIAAVIRLVDISALRSLLQTNRADFTLAVVSFLGVAVFGILAGVGIAIGLSVLALLERAWHPYSAVLGRVSGLQGYHDQVRHPEGRQVPGLLIFRFDAPLFFANAEVFRDAVHRALASAPSRIARVTVAAEPITDVDSTAADTLVGLLDDLDRQGIEFSFAEIKGPVKDKLQRYGIYERIGEEQFYRTIGEAVHKYVEEKGVDWRDWEDEEEERN